MALRQFLFGDNPRDIQLTDPDLERARATREQLRRRYQAQLAGGQTAGETAITDAARLGVEQLGQQARASAGGARGFARLAALGQSNALANTGAQRLLGQANVAAGAQRAQDLGQAEAGLLQLDRGDLQQWEREEELRRQRARPGALGLFGNLAGMGVGALTGNAAAGGKVGGVLGSGLQQMGQRWL